jgi:hypothetical protein
VVSYFIVFAVEFSGNIFFYIKFRLGGFVILFEVPKSVNLITASEEINIFAHLRSR